MPDEFLTVADVAERLKLNKQTIYNWIDAGTLPHARIGRRVRIRSEDLDTLVGAQEKNEELLTVAEAAEVLGVSQQTVRNWMEAGRLPHVRIGRRVRIKQADIAQALEPVEHRSPTPAPAKQLTAADFWDGEGHADAASPRPA